MKARVAFWVGIWQQIRPKFYNKITWVVVVTGLTLMTTSLLELIVIALISKAFKLSITGNDPLIGVLLVAIALVYNAYMCRLMQLAEGNGRSLNDEERLHHDRDVFRKLDALCNEEQVRHILSSIGTHHAYGWDLIRPFDELRDHGTLTEYGFLSSGIQETLQQFLVRINELSEFLSRHCFPLRGAPVEGDFSLRMHPEWNIDLEGTGTDDEYASYEKMRTLINSHISDVSTAYREFRTNAKQQLHL